MLGAIRCDPFRRQALEGRNRQLAARVDPAGDDLRDRDRVSQRPRSDCLAENLNRLGTALLMRPNQARQVLGALVGAEPGPVVL